MSLYDVQSAGLPWAISANPGSGQHRTAGKAQKAVSRGGAFGGLGKPVIAAATAIAGNHNSVTALQTYLNKQGYHIAVDGQRGPETDRAVSAYHNGIHPATFNAKNKGVGAKTSAAGPGHNVGPATRTAPKVKGRVTATRGAASVTAAAAPGATSAAPTSAGDTLEQQVQAMIDQQYGPQVAALQQAHAAALAQGEADAAALGKAYGEVGQTATQAGGLTQASNQHLQDQQAQAQGNAVQLFGGPDAGGSAAEAQAFSNINQGELAQLASSQQAFDTNMVPVIGTQGANAQAQARAAAQANAAEIANQLAALKSEQGAAYTSTLAQARQQAQQDAREQQALDLATATAPSKIAEAKANASIATQKALNFGNEFKLKLHQAGMSDKRTNAYIASANARIKAINTKAKKDANGGIDYTDANTLGVMKDNLSKGIFNKNGGFTVHPGVAKRTLDRQLQVLFPKGVPTAVHAIVGNLIEEGLARAHNNKLWAGVQYNPKTGGVVDKTGPSKKKKK